MEVKNLANFTLVLVLVGLLIGIGVVTLEKFAVSSADKLTHNETVSLVNGTAVALSKSYVTSITSISNNETTSVSTSNYTTTGVSSGGPAETAYITLDEQSSAVIYDSTYGVEDYVVYVYRDTGDDAPTSILNARTELGSISTNWVGLIVTVAIMSIILVIVIRSFRGR